MNYFFLFLLICSGGMICVGEDINKTYLLWYERPAFNRGADYNRVVSRGFPYDEDWERWSLPIGNGYMGASIFGRTDTERIQLSEKTLANKGCYGQGGFTNFAEIYLDIHHYSTKNYKRGLCLNNAVATVEYEYENTVYRREYFASYPDQVIGVKLKADKPGQLSFKIRPVMPYLNPTGRKGDGRSGKVSAYGDSILLTGEMEFFRLPYEAQIKVKNYGGKLMASNDADKDNGSIQVDRADSVVIWIAAGTSYQLNEQVFLLPPVEKCRNNAHPHAAVSARIDAVCRKGYEVVKNAHVSDYQALFNRVDLILTQRVPSIPTDRLQQNYQMGKYDTYLEELYFQYGRYLLISSSRPGALPPNLQGVWTQYDYTPWSGGYWHNINIQMNYWPVFNTNLAELFIPFVQYNEAYRKAAEKEAGQYILKNNPMAVSDVAGENGWAVGTGANAYAVNPPGGHSGPGTGGFTTKLFWDYYDFTRDRKLLEEHVYPALLGMAKFLSKTLKEDQYGRLLAVPSSSPEQQHNGGYYQTKGCTFDQGMIWENFRDLLEAAKILKKKDPFLKRVEEQMAKLDPVNIGADGQLKEYREENNYSDIGDPRHRHISHLCLVYPGSMINSTTPEWMKAAQISLKMRGDSAGRWAGWPMVHRLAVWARMKEGNQAYQFYRILLSKGTMENLWGLCPPFQIDSNLGSTAGVAEMLLQSHEGFIEPLPALPDAWRDGAYRGLVARGCFEIALNWQKGKAQKMTVLSGKGEKCRIQYEGIAGADITNEQGKKVKYSVIGLNRVEFNTKPGESYVITFL